MTRLKIPKYMLKHPNPYEITARSIKISNHHIIPDTVTLTLISKKRAYPSLTVPQFTPVILLNYRPEPCYMW